MKRCALIFCFFSFLVPLSSFIGAAEKTPAAVTSNSSVNVERPNIQQAPPSLNSNSTFVTTQSYNGPIISAGPASVSNVNNVMKVSQLPPQNAPPLASMMPPLPITKPTLIINPVPAANPPTLTNMRNATMSPVTTPGSLLSGLKTIPNKQLDNMGNMPTDILGKELIDAVKKEGDAMAKKLMYPTNVNGKDQISFGMVDDSLIAKSMSLPKSGMLHTCFFLIYMVCIFP